MHVLLTLPLVGGEWSASRPGRFTLGERVPGTHWRGGWLGPRDGLDDMERRTFLPHRDSTPTPQSSSPVASRHTDCAIPALKSSELARK
jgi:hypothetical protein